MLVVCKKLEFQNTQLGKVSTYLQSFLGPTYVPTWFCLCTYASMEIGYEYSQQSNQFHNSRTITASQKNLPQKGEEEGSI